MSKHREDAFDPFGLDDSAPGNVLQSDFAPVSNAFAPFDADFIREIDRGTPLSPPPVNRVSRPSVAIALPPKINVKLNINEEVSSSSNGSSEGASKVTIEGSIDAQVQCSDATKNSPFILVARSLMRNGGSIDLRPNPHFVSNIGDQTNVVTVPKHEIGLIPIALYSLTNEVQHMPLLLERKITVSGTSCRIAVQVRSKLSNQGNMEKFTIAVAVPECVNGDSIEIVQGEGEYDELKRTILWKLDELQKGESFMVSAQAKLWEATTEIQFPVMLRCSSNVDQISDVAFEVAPAEGYPSSVTFITSQSFQLLHRLA